MSPWPKAVYVIGQWYFMSSLIAGHRPSMRGDSFKFLFALLQWHSLTYGHTAMSSSTRLFKNAEDHERNRRTIRLSSVAGYARVENHGHGISCNASNLQSWGQMWGSMKLPMGEQGTYPYTSNHHYQIVFTKSPLFYQGLYTMKNQVHHVFT